MNGLPTPDGLGAIIHALRWVAAHGDRDIAEACQMVMREHYPHLRKQAWSQLTPTDRQQLRQLMSPAPQKSEAVAA